MLAVVYPKETGNNPRALHMSCSSSSKPWQVCFCWVLFKIYCNSRPYTELPVEILIVIWIPSRASSSCQEHDLCRKLLVLCCSMRFLFSFSKTVSFWVLGQMKPYLVFMKIVHQVMKFITIHMNVAIAKFQLAIHVLRWQVRLNISERTRTAQSLIMLRKVEVQTLAAAADACTVPCWFSEMEVYWFLKYDAFFQPHVLFSLRPSTTLFLLLTDLIPCFQIQPTVFFSRLNCLATTFTSPRLMVHPYDLCSSTYRIVVRCSPVSSLFALS